MSHCLRLEWRGGRTEEIEASGDESILEATESADVALPFGCRTGACATCTARLLAGDVDYRRPPRALKADDREAGYVLTCVAEPRADCRLEVGADVAGGLRENPWK